MHYRADSGDGRMDLEAVGVSLSRRCAPVVGTVHRQIQKEVNWKTVGWLPGTGGKVWWGVATNEHRVSFWGNDNILSLS